MFVPGRTETSAAGDAKRLVDKQWGPSVCIRICVRVLCAPDTARHRAAQRGTGSAACGSLHSGQTCIFRYKRLCVAQDVCVQWLSHPSLWFYIILNLILCRFIFPPKQVLKNSKGFKLFKMVTSPNISWKYHYSTVSAVSPRVICNHSEEVLRMTVPTPIFKKKSKLFFVFSF